MLLNFVNAINAIHGQVFLVLLAFTGMLLLYARYHKAPASASVLATLNNVHLTVLGFVVAILGMLLVLSGHDKFGEEVFVSGASFMGGIGASKIVSGAVPNAPQAPVPNP